MKIIIVAGARPNFMKIAPIIKELKKHEQIEFLLVHTGQHFDTNMSGIFFSDLGIPEPDINLGVNEGSPIEQISEIMTKFEKTLLDYKPSLVIVVGDVNSTLACALTAAKLNIKVAHVEAGLRSFDREMPEEINRIVTDRISDYLFTSEKDAETNLVKEGIDKKKIYFVGNVMIDTLLNNKKKVSISKILEKLKLTQKSYSVITLHRPKNVDNKKKF
jgi:UDP-N-acetylglucosamine 2-epimerase (non-hydrolysing)